MTFGYKWNVDLNRLVKRRDWDYKLSKFHLHLCCILSVYVTICSAWLNAQNFQGTFKWISILQLAIQFQTTGNLLAVVALEDEFLDFINAFHSLLHKLARKENIKKIL
jgi:hypothetical protein